VGIEIPLFTGEPKMTFVPSTAATSGAITTSAAAKRQRELQREEARAGWEMLEKFDDNRVRFRRKIEHRDGDLHRDIDPYRTLVGMSMDRLGFLIASSVLLGVGLLLGVVFWLTNLR
jgi:hypothetical protein